MAQRRKAEVYGVHRVSTRTGGTTKYANYAITLPKAYGLDGYTRNQGFMWEDMGDGTLLLVPVPLTPIRYKKWDAADDQVVLRRDLTVDEMAQRLGRTVGSVRNRIAKLREEQK